MISDCRITPVTSIISLFLVPHRIPRQAGFTFSAKATATDGKATASVSITSVPMTPKPAAMKAAKQAIVLVGVTFLVFYLVFKRACNMNPQVFTFLEVC
jgi:hypothetical protein